MSYFDAFAKGMGFGMLVLACALFVASLADILSSWWDREIATMGAGIAVIALGGLWGVMQHLTERVNARPTTENKQ